MLVISSEEILQGEAGSIQKRENVGFHPFAAQGLGPGLGIVILGIEPIQQQLVHGTFCGDFPVPVHLQAYLPGKSVDHVIDRRNVKSYALVPFPPGDIGEAADIQAIIILSEKEVVSYGNQRCPLASQHNIQPTEVRHRGNARFRRNGGTVPNLVHDLLPGLVEHRGAVGGDDIRLHAEFFHKLIHPLPQISAVFAVEGHKLVGAHMLDVLSQLSF